MVNQRYPRSPRLLATSPAGLFAGGDTGQGARRDDARNDRCFAQAVSRCRGRLAENEQQPAPIDDFSDMNDYIYLRNKSRQLDDVQTDFHTSYAQVVTTVRSMDDALLFEPGRLSWRDGSPLYGLVIGNTYGHYEEHIGPIQNWLASQS